MRAEAKTNALHVRAIAGTHVVLLAFKPSETATADLRGFAISRSVAGKPFAWLEGVKYFATTVSDTVKGAKFASHEQPFQTFFWSDYEASPGTAIAYRIVPRCGDPANMVDGDAVDIAITTEVEDDGRHGVWFNRGIVASNRYATHFHNQQLTKAMENDVGDDGTMHAEVARWLSRGLAEACLNFINRTVAGEALRVCAYEFSWQPVLAALMRASQRGVDVLIIYHTTKENREAIAEAALPGTILTERTRPQTPHNKFIVKLSDGKPRQVWTGSTNLTSSGFLGQTNVGHLVTDDAVAKTYLQYWQGLQHDPDHAAAKASALALSPNPPNAIPKNAIVPFFSPRANDHMLNWYGDRIRDACSLVLLTLPFNVAKSILTALDGAKRALRLVIREMEPDQAVRAAEHNNAGRLAFSNGAILGKSFQHTPGEKGGAKVSPIVQGHLDQWFVDEELARPTNSGHVFFVHTKILLIDPLSDDPLVCTGSANFSSKSIRENDENMLLIRGETRVADIYLTELDRIFKHFADRDAINRSAQAGQSFDAIHLDTTQSWIEKNGKPGSYKHNRLLTFFPDQPGDCAWSRNAEADANPF